MRILILIIMLVTLTGCSTNIGYIENKVYPDSILKDTNNDTSDISVDKYISRSDAIAKAYEIINKGFGINVDKDLLNEYISLYEQNSNFYWSITFNNIEDKEYYYIKINCDTGEVMEVSNYGEVYDEYYSEDINDLFTIDECKNIIKPLADLLEINIDEYLINIYDNSNGVNVELENDKKVCYYFYINKSNKSLQDFQKGD